MELDITSFFDLDTSECYGSVATHGANAGRDTWNAAKEVAAQAPLMTTEEQFAAFRDHVKGFGAWDDEEIAAWNADELNALLIQMISGDVSEMPTDDNGEIIWDDEEWNANHGGRLSKGDNDKVYYYLGD